MAVPKSKLARTFYRCADMRRVEARILFEADQPTGAVYLAGYVVEFMLKALNLESTPASQQVRLLNDLKTLGHNLPRLLERYRENGGGLPPRDVARALALVSSWTSDIRYDPTEINRGNAERFLKAVDVVRLWADGRL